MVDQDSSSSSNNNNDNGDVGLGFKLRLRLLFDADFFVCIFSSKKIKHRNATDSKKNDDDFEVETSLKSMVMFG